jgi:hypothetical protein
MSVDMFRTTRDSLIYFLSDLSQQEFNRSDLKEKNNGKFHWGVLSTKKFPLFTQINVFFLSLIFVSNQFKAGKLVLQSYNINDKNKAQFTKLTIHANRMRLFREDLLWVNNYVPLITTPNHSVPTFFLGFSLSTVYPDINSIAFFDIVLIGNVFSIIFFFQLLWMLAPMLI